MRRLVLLLIASGCTDEELPAPVVTRVEPADICTDNSAESSSVLVRVTGRGFVVNDDHTVGSVFELWRDGVRQQRDVAVLEPNLDARVLTFLMAGEGAPPRTEPPKEYEMRLVNPDGKFSIGGAFRIYSPFNLRPWPTVTASVGSIATLQLEGNGFYDGMAVILESQTPLRAERVDVTSRNALTATFDLSNAFPGTYAVTVQNPGGCELTTVSAFTVAP